MALSEPDPGSDGESGTTSQSAARGVDSSRFQKALGYPHECTFMQDTLGWKHRQFVGAL